MNKEKLKKLKKSLTDEKVEEKVMEVLIKATKGNKGDIGPMGEKGSRGYQGPNGERGPIGLIGRIGPAGRIGPVGPVGKEGPLGPQGLKGNKGDSGDKGEKGDSLDAKAIVTKLLEEIDIKLTEKEKKVLKKLEQKLIIMIQKLQVHGGGISRADIIDLISGNEYTRADLSAQCNGANMVFTLPDDYVSGSVALWSTQFPIVYRPTTDFTETAANQITLVAAQVGPPKTGQTLVCTYDKD